MDIDKIKKFIIPIVILIATLGLATVLIMGTATKAQKYIETKEDVQAKQTDLKDLQKKLEQVKRESEEEKKKEELASKKESKQFYKPIMTGLDREAAIAGEFTEILELIRENKIKVRSIKYDYDPADDNFVSNAGPQYNVARLNMEMVTNYQSYENFLKELYKHEHFLDIQSIEIVPYKKNKSILLINFKLKLYSRK